MGESAAVVDALATERESWQRKRVVRKDGMGKSTPVVDAHQVFLAGFGCRDRESWQRKLDVGKDGMGKSAAVVEALVDVARVRKNRIEAFVGDAMRLRERRIVVAIGVSNEGD